MTCVIEIVLVDPVEDETLHLDPRRFFELPRDRERVEGILREYNQWAASEKDVFLVGSVIEAE